MPLLLCPNCQTGMQEVNRSGVQIDVCTNCRGVWLDRGELEKLLSSFQEPQDSEQQERMQERPVRAEVPPKEDFARRQYHEERYEQPHHREYGKAGYRKKSAFERLSDLFD